MSAPDHPMDGSPFAARTVLAMVLFGALAFLLALYFIAISETGRVSADGGAHVGGNGLNGYAALAGFLERRGWEIARSRNQAALDGPGLVVLTPPGDSDAQELADLVSRRRSQGPTVVILPKWSAFEAGRMVPGARRGWVVLGQPASPRWQGFADDVSVAIGPARGWRLDALAGPLALPGSVQWARPAPSLDPLVTVSGEDRRILAAWYQEDGADTSIAGSARSWPVLMVFEPDLLDNAGMARAANARLAEALFGLAAEGTGHAVRFDVTLNGLGRTDNLLTLAFSPPFVAITICLLVAAALVGWRAFGRFGPPLKQERSASFGKGQLIRNSAGIVLRSRRFHLLGRPYAALLRRRMAVQLGLARAQGGEASDEAIDRRLAALGQGETAFSEPAHRLEQARRPAELLRAARALKHLERITQS